MTWNPIGIVVGEAFAEYVEQLRSQSHATRSKYPSVRLETTAGARNRRQKPYET